MLLLVAVDELEIRLCWTIREIASDLVDLIRKGKVITFPESFEKGESKDYLGSPCIICLLTNNAMSRHKSISFIKVFLPLSTAMEFTVGRSEFVLKLLAVLNRFERCRRSLQEHSWGSGSSLDKEILMLLTLRAPSLFDRDSFAWNGSALLCTICMLLYCVV
jgi:hypothetical protein